MIDFEWDPTKAMGNLRKHGVAFREAATVFRDPLSITVYDPDHSEEEDRYITVGTS
ncbi:MAG: BrnT family toxin, partial [candidate division NC10 bacterium]|nr:BrnT family toxin [candidate division NC10 bacterium]